jgi:basic membrane lipoprotein Med (substrate-binding protein (PBP1-ABC) superfamily)
MRRSNLLRYLSATLFSISVSAFAASSCSVITDSDIAAGGIGMACSSDSDCQGGSCDSGACIFACDADGDCPETSKCLGRRCVVEAAVGEPCTTPADCQGAKCEKGVCTTNCTTSEDCPPPSICLATTCQKPLKVAGIWIGLATVAEGWTLTHHEGVLAAQENLGYIDYDYGQGLLGEPAEQAVDDFVADGYEVIIANSFDYLGMVDKKAAQYPDTKFLICSGEPKDPNVASYFANMEQAWFVAGRIAARKTLTNHLGFIGSFNNGEVVRHINAFTLGAKYEAVKSDLGEMEVEVRWVGFWYDPDFATPQYEYTPLHMGDAAVKKKLTAEEYLTAKLIDSGADVITHNLDNQLSSRYVGIHTSAGTLKEPQDPTKNFTVWTIANDNRYGWRDQNGEPFVNAIGTTYWNWEPLYTTIFEAIHTNTFETIDYRRPLEADPETSIVSFGLSSLETDITSLALQQFLDDAAAAGPEGVYKGPITSTGQRPSPIASGEVIDADEWRNMCWFTEGVVERQNPNDPTSPLVDALVPTTGHLGQMGDKKEPPEGTDRMPTSAPEMLIDLGSSGFIWDCNTNNGG